MGLRGVRDKIERGGELGTQPCDVVSRHRQAATVGPSSAKVAMIR
jgi:hypothetical protein